MSTSTMVLSDERRQALTQLVAAWSRHRAGSDDGPTAGPAAGEPWVEVRRAEIVRPGRPGVLDVEAAVDGRVAHAVLGILRPGQEAHPLRGEEPALGLFEDDEGLGVVVDALRDAELVSLLLEAVLAEAGRPLEGGPGVPVGRGDDAGGVVLDFGDWCTLTVFPWPVPGPHPGVELLVVLDQAGFNHLAAPLARWRRDDHDLGLVQELHPSRVDGWALALTSLRDLYGGGGAHPENAGGDFAPEARALGVMVARMHLALDRSFGRRSSEARQWAQAIEETVGRRDPSLLERPEVRDVLVRAAAAGRVQTVRTHGDLHLGRIVRTDQGWVLSDFCSVSSLAHAREQLRPPLADVADMLWSVHQVATVAAAERDQVGRPGLSSPAEAWAARNRRALVAGYLSTPGIGGLVPSQPEAVRNLLALFELERASRLLAAPVG